MWPHEFDLLWRLSLEPLTAGELGRSLPLSSPSRYDSARTTGTKLKGLVRRGFIRRDESGIYRITKEGRAYVER